MTATTIFESSKTEEIDDDISDAASASDMDEANDQSDDGQSEDEEDNANEGWADSMAKILKSKKPKGKKSLVLSKAKKTSKSDIKIEKKLDFEVIGEEKVDDENIAKDSDEEPAAKKKRESLPNFRTKPTVLDREREKLLSKIATRGVVQLFNTVRNQQREFEKKIEEAGPLERKKEKVIKSLDKNKFLDSLMGQSKSEIVNETLATKMELKKEAKEEKAGWNVLRDDFMMGAKMKDWDKKENEVEGEMSGISDTDSE